MEKTSFGQRLKLAFGNAKNAEIARKIGVGETAVSNYMAGRIPDAEKLIQIRKSTNCDLNWLLTGEGDTDRDAGTVHLRAEIVEKLMAIAEEQAPIIHSHADLAAGNVLIRRTCELLVEYLISVGLADSHLIEREDQLMTKADAKRAERFTFVADREPSIEDRIRELVKKESKMPAKIGAPDEFRDMIRDIVKEEVGDSRKRPVYPLQLADDEEETTRRKAG